jgi:deoxyribonuclease-1
MKYLAIIFVLITTSVLAQQEQKVQGKWAFYGEDFYKTLASKEKFERPMFDKILNQAHNTVRGKFDTMTAECVKSSACYKHISVGYDKARKIMFGELDIQKDTEGTFILDVYCGKKFYFKSVDSASRMHSQVNIEHTWPQSKFNGTFPKDQQKSDMHHLYLSDSLANSTRGNSPFGMVSTERDRMGGEGCAASKFGFSRTTTSEVYTPPVQHRGNVARALFYFSMHYNLPIDRSQEKILREWHKNDPINEDDLRRHELIAKYQKIRNPFIDHPELVDRVLDF